MAYCTVQDVQTYAGVTVDNAAIVRSQALIETYSNRTEASTGQFSDRDKHWLKLATVYQAAYLDAHPDIMQMMDVANYSQGDISMTFKGSSDNAMISPLAKKALGMISWNRTRTIEVSSDFVRNEDIVDDENDFFEKSVWEPLG